MPIKHVAGGYKWGNHGKTYKSRQKAVNQMRAAFANGYHGESYVTEKVKDVRPRTLSSVPGLKFITHHVAGMKYFSLQHEKSGKHLIKSMHVQKIRPVVELANHFFAGYDFTKSHKDIAKDAPHLYGAVKSFRQEVDRIHAPIPEKPKAAKKKKK